MSWWYLGEEMDTADYQYHPEIDSYLVVGSVGDVPVSYEYVEPRDRLEFPRVVQ